MDPVILGLVAFAFIAGLIFFISRRKSKKNATGAGGIGTEKDGTGKQGNESQTT